MPRKMVGFCADCSTHIWDAGTDPKSWGGKRATMLLANGSFMDVTLCNDCLENPNLDRIWENVLEGWIAEGGGKYAAWQAKDDFILSMIYTMPWNVVEMVPYTALAETKHG